MCYLHNELFDNNQALTLLRLRHIRYHAGLSLQATIELMMVVNARSQTELIECVSRGNKAKYVFFWGHSQRGEQVGKSCFSQWYHAPFERDGKRYSTAEHFMMAAKARLFNDHKVEQQILQARHPGEAKQLGRQVRGFHEADWVARRFEIVVAANMAKFSQHQALKNFLLNTGNRVLVEASPVDKIWGIGLTESDDAAANPRLWKGLNLLGFALMTVRQQLA